PADSPVLRTIRTRRLTPNWEPIPRVPVPPAAAHEHDPNVVTSPPTAIVALPVVIAERRILVASESGTVEIIVNPCSPSVVIGEVPRAVGCDVSIPIDRHVVASPKLVGVSITIHLDIPCPVHRNVSFAINRNIVPSAKLLTSASLVRCAHPG